MFNKNNVETILKNLKEKYQDGAFVSEAQLQLEFALEVIKIKNETGVTTFTCTPEYPIITTINGLTKRCEVDLLIHDTSDNKNTIIEFKYKTANSSSKDPNKRLIIDTTLNQKYEPSNQLAQMLGKFDVLSDLERTENIIKDMEVENGFIILVTNDHNYWEENSKSGCKYGDDFSLIDGRIIKSGSKLTWKPDKSGKININSIGAIRNRELNFLKEYKIERNLYYTRLVPKNYNEFKYLVLEVDKEDDKSKAKKE